MLLVKSIYYVCGFIYQVKKNDEKTHMLTAEETLQFQKKVKKF